MQQGVKLAAEAARVAAQEGLTPAARRQLLQVPGLFAKDWLNIILRHQVLHEPGAMLAFNLEHCPPA